ncbi:MAG: hypothetical protein DHS20C13_18800 [Thermodesulfobacteriota bacterium]|nr:MAG: hypothetical protein DHS20C13_18800 [Thermodesulfobacteriota bacterium]
MTTSKSASNPDKNPIKAASLISFLFETLWGSTDPSNPWLTGSINYPCSELKLIWE